MAPFDSCIHPSTMLVPRNPATNVILSCGQSIGLAFYTESGFLSLCAASVVLILIFLRIRRDCLGPMDIYVIALFVAEFIQGLGGTMNLKWVIAGELHTGAFCTTQGVIQQLGECGVALATLAIGVQTFTILWWLKSPTIRVASISIAILATFVVLFVSIGFGIHTHPPNEYYAVPTRYWCWLGSRYAGERIAGEYFWFWCTLLVSIVFYIPLFLWHLGYIKPHATRWYMPSVWQRVPEMTHRAGQPYIGWPDTGETVVTQMTGMNGTLPSSAGHSESSDQKIMARGPSELRRVIWYPIMYCIVILPLSIVRFIGFKQEATGDKINRTPDSATFAVVFVFSLSGVLNTCLYLLTRSRIFWSSTTS